MRRRIIICLVLLLTLCVLGDAIAMFCLYGSIRELSAVAESHRIQVMRANLTSYGVRVESDLLASRDGQRHRINHQADTLARFERSMDECGACHHMPAVQAQLDELRATYDSYVAAVERLNAAGDDEDTAVLVQQAGTLIDRLVLQTTDMGDQASHHVAVRSSEAAASVRNAWFILCGTLVLALVVGGVTARHLHRRLTKPVEALLEGINRIRQGDLMHRLPVDADPEFRQLGEALNHAYENLKHAQQGAFQAEKMAAVGKLAAGVAHEVGNPLASISSVAQMMRRKGQSSEQTERIDLIMEQISRISRIVRELLTFSRAVPRGDRVRVDVAALVDQAVSLLSYDRRAKNIRIVCDLAANLDPVRGDTDKLLPVFTNIIINAFDALSAESNESPTLHITAQQEDGAVILRFRDNGPGIRKSELGTVFEPFFTTKEPGAGTGLGLWICYQVIQEHNGVIRVESQPGQGATVSIRLPTDPERVGTARTTTPGQRKPRAGKLAAR